MQGKAQAKKKKQSSTGSSSSAKTGLSKQRVNVSAIGKHIVQELDAAGSSDTLAKWMAHYVAELMQQADKAADVEKRTELRKEIESLVLELWKNRAALPGQVDPNKRLAGAIRVLEKFDSSENRFFRNSHDSQRIEREAMTAGHEISQINLQLALIELVQGMEDHHSDETILPLSDDDMKLRSQLNGLLQHYTQRVVFANSQNKKPEEESEIYVLKNSIRASVTKAILCLEAVRELLAVGSETTNQEEKSGKGKSARSLRGKRTKI
jgi:hypothetical protein